MNDETKWTPGPWSVVPTGDEWNRGTIGTPEPMKSSTGYWAVAQCNKRRDECEANAHLVASAPELYEALKVARQVIYYGEGWPHGWNISRLDAALAKARGES